MRPGAQRAGQQRLGLGGKKGGKANAGKKPAKGKTRKQPATPDAQTSLAISPDSDD